MNSTELPLTPRSKRTVALASRFAAEHDHAYTGTQHLLMGVLGPDQPEVEKMLADCGVSRSDLYTKLLVNFENEFPRKIEVRMPDMSELVKSLRDLANKLEGSP